ncbi:MAG: AAA family ATPase, partial [Fuerstiella sp.]
LLDAFRRRWIPALAVALPAALLVAGLLWQMVPAEYESSALLKIHQFEKRIAFETKERASEFLTYRDSQINFLKSRPVLTSALRVEGVRDCQLMRDMKYPVEWLEEELEVDFDYSDEFIRISLAGEFPEDLATVVNAVKDVYLDEVVYNERNERIQELRTLEENFTELDETVRKNQKRIDQLAENLGTGDSKIAVVSLGLVQEKMQGLQADLRAINADIREEEAIRQYMKERGLSPNQLPSRVPGFGAAVPSGLPTTAMDQQTLLQRQLMAVQLQIRRFKASIRDPNHPDLVALQHQEQELKQLLTGVPDAGAGSSPMAMSKYDWLVKQREKLEVELKQTQEHLDLMGARVVELEREKADIEYLVKTRDELAQQIANRRIELNAPLRVTEVQKANVPEKRDIKKRIQAATMSGMGVFMLIVGGFTMFEWFSHRVGSTSDIANAVNLRLVGTIPSPDRGGLLGLGIFAGKVDYDEWNRAVIESMDVVRTYLMRHIDPRRPASILVTSASANEGKTTVSCQLAASLARSGKRVALVDCDFRRPSAHLLLEGHDSPGICEYLRGEVSLSEIQQRTQAGGLTFIAAGQVDQTVLQKLSADGGRTLIDTLKNAFDFVIIDTSPLLFVAEPSMLAQNADVVLMSTRKDYSRIPYVAQCRDSLRSLQVPLLGAVMVGSDSDFQRQSYGYRQEVQRQNQAQHHAPVGS